MIEIGQIFRDNDPRMRNRHLTVTGFEDGPKGTRAVCADRGGKLFRVRLDRMHSDGKPRRGGFSWVPRGTE